MESEFSVATVEQRVRDQLQRGKLDPVVWEECRDIYLQEIFDWSDYFTETHGSDSNGSAAGEFKELLIRLWHSYANFEAGNKQFKKAVDVYRKAVTDPIVGVTAHMFEVFAEYYLGKEKPALAQKVLIEGLCKELPTEENKKLWHYFLVLMRSISNMQDLTLEKLYEEVVTSGIEKNQKLSYPPGCDDRVIASITIQYLAPKGAPAMGVAESKSSEEPVAVAQPMKTIVSPAPAVNVAVPNVYIPSIKTAGSAASSSSVVSAPVNIRWIEDDTVQKTSKPTTAPTGLFASQAWTAEQITTAFQARPNMLFVSPAKEPMLSGLNAVTPDERLELEMFLGCALNQVESQPRARDLVHVLEALWYQQALRERHFDAWTTKLRNLHMQEEAIVAGRHHRHSEQFRLLHAAFQQRCSAERALLHSYIHKCMYDILLEQVGILTSLKFPRFSTTFLHQLEQWDVVARKHASTSTSAASTSASSGGPYDFSAINLEVTRLQKLLAALLSLRMHSLQPISQATSSTAHQHHQQHYNQQQHNSLQSQSNTSLQQPQQAPQVSSAHNAAHVKIESALDGTQQNTSLETLSIVTQSTDVPPIGEALDETSSASRLNLKRELSSESAGEGEDAAEFVSTPGGHQYVVAGGIKRKTKRRRSVSHMQYDSYGGGAVSSYGNSLPTSPATSSGVPMEEDALHHQMPEDGLSTAEVPESSDAMVVVEDSSVAAAALSEEH